MPSLDLRGISPKVEASEGAVNDENVDTISPGVGSAGRARWSKRVGAAVKAAVGGPVRSVLGAANGVARTVSGRGSFATE